MKKLCALLAGLIFLLVFTGNLWAVISKKCGRTCGGELTVTQGSSETFDIQGFGVDFARSVSVSNTSAISAAIVQKWNGAQNVHEFDERSICPGKVEWGRIRIKVTATMSAPFLHYVYINYPAGPRDRFTVKVIRRAGVTGHTVLTPLTQPFSGPVDVRLTGIGLSNAFASAGIIIDAYTKLKDSSGNDVTCTTGICITAAVNPQTATDTQVEVRLTFSNLPRLTDATIEFNLSSSNQCSGLNGAPVRYRVHLTAPRGGPNYVASHNYCIPTIPCSTTFTVGAPICVTIRLDRPTSTVCARSFDRSTGRYTECGEVVYWTVSNRNAIKSDGSTPYDPLAINNIIRIANGQQEKRICVIGISGSREGTMSRFITWKPDYQVDTFPNRRESTFIIKTP
jgi:hypothetical protein